MASIPILIPCYQERDFIGPCLESVLAFELPEGDSIEILVIDGMSTDGTREAVARMAAVDPRIRLVDNPARIQSAALNQGLRMVRGDYVLRLDAHSTYPRNYLKLCVETARRTGADNVGGIVVTRQRGEGTQAALVQALTTHRFGVGNSGFRTDAREGPADTVPYGFFRREIFDRVGLFDERLLRAQDYEMNRRIRHAGGTVWLNPEIQLDYFQQPDLRSFLRKQIRYEAPYIAYMWYLAPYTFAARHMVTALFVAGLLVGALASFALPLLAGVFAAVMGLYGVLAVVSAAQQARRYRRLSHLVLLPLCFFLFHVFHGMGTLLGLARLAVGRAPVQQVAEPWTGAGRSSAWPAVGGSRNG